MNEADEKPIIKYLKEKYNAVIQEQRKLNREFLETLDRLEQMEKDYLKKNRSYPPEYVNIKTPVASISFELMKTDYQTIQTRLKKLMKKQEQIIKWQRETNRIITGEM